MKPFLVLTGLEGRRIQNTRAVEVNSKTDVIKALRAGYAATAAGPEGAVNIWRDDAGKLHGEKQVCRVVRASEIFKNLKEMGIFVDRWLKEIKG